MTLREHLRAAAQRMDAADISMASHAAESLMMFALGCDRAHLFAHPERELTDEEAGNYQAMVDRRAAGVPVQYITGHQEFYGLDFRVTPDVLIPRPETEHLVEAALEKVAQLAQGQAALKIVDVGTGSGCIALALAHASREKKVAAEIHAVDISEAALSVARENAAALGLAASVNFKSSDLLSAFNSSPESFDIVVSNPPYVGRNEADKVQREVREFEPAVAVFGGDDGMDIYKRLIPQADYVLKPGGWLLMEIGYSVETQIRALLQGWNDVSVRPDLQGIPRVAIARKP